MSLRKFSAPTLSQFLPLTLKINIRGLLTFATAAIVVCTLANSAQGQYGSLPIGSVTSVTSLTSCPGGGWYSYTSPGGTTYSMNCSSAKITNCSGAQDINFTFGYLSPANIIPGTVNGVIVFFNGKDGTTPDGDATGTPTGETEYAQAYFTGHYEVVQIEWSFAWEQLLNPWPYDSQPLGNIQAAACRPATFLNYVFNSPNMYQGVYNANTNPNAGMCIQGASAGSTQAVYTLAYYAPPSGQQWWTDNVELLSGPVLSDIQQGCIVPNASSVTICGLQNCTNGTTKYQCGCQLGSSNATWTLSPSYLTGTNTSVGNWTNDPTCNNGSATSSYSNSRWLMQSIVDQSGVTGQGATPNFNYPNTGMSGWLCRSVQNPHMIDCGTNFDGQYCPNNSSPEAQIFYAQFGPTNLPRVYNVYAVDGCAGPEGVNGGRVGGTTGPDTIPTLAQDMTTNCKHPTN